MNVEIRNLTKTFGPLRANDSLSLRFAAGQIHGVLGENGAGKSTLMKLLSGFLKPDEGEILLDGKAAQLGSPARALQAGVGMVHQDPLDIPAFTAIENFYCGSHRLAMRNRTEARRKLAELAARFGFAVDPDAQIASLTVGQRQQLEIMRLLAGGARLLILDEPTTGISAAQARALFAALKQLAADGATVLFVSHKLDEVAELCDTVSVLRAGKLVGAGQMAMPQPQAALLDLMFGSAGPQHAEALPERAPASGEAPPTWQLRDVKAREGVVRLRGVSLDIPAGASVGLAGMEGSGQQVLLRLLAGSLPPTGGAIRVGGTDLTGAAMRRFRDAGVEYLPADRLSDGVIGSFSLQEHFALLRPASERLVNPQAALESAKAAIAAYNIKATPSTPIASLSGGNQQRAMLALVPPDARGILLDQPTRGLDVASSQVVWEKMHARRTQGASVVFASADLDEILENSDFVLVFFAGKLSPLLPRASLDFARLAELIGGIGFDDHGFSAAQGADSPAEAQA